MLDHGGLRWPTLGRVENLTKRQIAEVKTDDLSLLMRMIFGFGTPKQWAAQSLLTFVRLLNRLIRLFGDPFTFCLAV